ncbi:hypothetical protein SI65_06064 [Aspergillus cristatus]|uniref:Uncharacterized protein n=1 Tax=Aspergillus cristatus TaxID=573508 RepID=A0A1E3BB32_ASPCR|nr:hypothetical protein SI65_06064 [Aspergillus cristatus]
MKIATSFVVAFASLAACAPIVAKKATIVGSSTSIQKREENDADVVFVVWNNGKKLQENEIEKRDDADADVVFVVWNNGNKKLEVSEGAVANQKRNDADADVVFVVWNNGDKKMLAQIEESGAQEQ